MLLKTATIMVLEATLFATIQPVGAAVRRDNNESCCETWSNWGPCIGGWEQRECQSPDRCNDVQVRACTPGGGGGGGGGGSSPTNTPTPTPTNTPTPSPTPTPRPWVKLKSTSFYSSGSLVNHIPLVPAAYDSEDDGSPYFIISGSGRASGLTAATSINLTGLNANAKANVNDWLASGYTSGWKMTPSSFGG